MSATEETTAVATETEMAAGTRRVTISKKPWSPMSALRAAGETEGTREMTRTGSRNPARIRSISARSPLSTL